MSSSDPQPPVPPDGPPPPSTQEIPVVRPASGATAVQPLPPHPNATTPPPVQPVDAPVPTGPVDFVPGLPGPGTPPPPPPGPPPAGPPVSGPSTAPGPVPPAHAPAPPASAAARSWPDTLEPDRPAAEERKLPRLRRPRDGGAALGLGLVVLAAVLLELGLALDFGGESYWSTLPLWSGFASVCVLLALVALALFARTGDRGRSGPAWRIGAAGLAGLAVFWLLVVLPVVAGDRGFVLTAALAALGGALWTAARRRD